MVGRKSQRSSWSSRLGHAGDFLIAVALVAFLTVACSRDEQTVASTSGEEAPQASAPAPIAPVAKAPAKPREPTPPKYVPKHPPEIEKRILEVRKLDERAPDALERAKKALSDEHPAVRLEGIALLEEIRRDEVTEPLGDLLDKDPDEEVRLGSVEALDYLRTPAAEKQLERGLDDPSPNVREAVVESLAFSGGPELLPKFEAALKKEGDREVSSDLEDAIESFKKQAAKAAEAAKQGSPTQTAPAKPEAPPASPNAGNSATTPTVDAAAKPEKVEASPMR